MNSFKNRNTFLKTTRSSSLYFSLSAVFEGRMEVRFMFVRFVEALSSLLLH